MQSNKSNNSNNRATIKLNKPKVKSNNKPKAVEVTFKSNSSPSHKTSHKTNYKSDYKPERKTDRNLDRKFDRKTDRQSKYKTEDKTDRKTDYKANRKSNYRAERKTDYKPEHKSDQQPNQQSRQYKNQDFKQDQRKSSFKNTNYRTSRNADTQDASSSFNSYSSSRSNSRSNYSKQYANHKTNRKINHSNNYNANNNEKHSDRRNQFQANDRNNNNNKNDYNHETDRPNRSNRSDRPNRTDRPNRSDSSDRPNRSDRSNRPNRFKNSNHSNNSNKPRNPSKSHNSHNSNNSNNLNKSNNLYTNNYSVRTNTVKILTNLLEDKTTLSSNIFSAILPKDQNLAKELCYGCLRWYQQLEYLSNLLLHKPLRNQELIVKNIVILGLYQFQFTRIPEYAIIASTVEVARELNASWATGLINAILRNFLRSKESFIQKLSILQNTKPAIYYSHPQWLAEKLQTTYPQEWKGILKINNEHPNMCLRVNQRLISRDEYLDLLTQQNIIAKKTTHSDCGIILEKPCNVDELPHFNDGWFSVQDEASQLVIPLLELQPNLTVLDACSAPGGKTTHILEAESKLKQLMAVEIDESRIQKIISNLNRLKFKQNLSQPTSQYTSQPISFEISQNISQDTFQKSPKNANDEITNCDVTNHDVNNGDVTNNKAINIEASNVQVICADINTPKTWWNGEKFDRILLDAPCSAVGVIRRHPDIKIIRQPEDIQNIVKQQFTMLNTLWDLLAKNGILVYTTCSILAEENCLNIKHFIEHRKQQYNEIIEEIPINSEWGISQIYGKQLLPQESNDGFYYVKLRKIA